jgi:alpha-galactosidase
MKFSLQYSGQLLEFECELYEQIGNDLLLHGRKVSIRVPFMIKAFYQHGWQSWSLTAWIDPDNYPGKSYPKSLHVLQNDLQFSALEHPNGSWLGAVSSFDGKVLFIGSLELESHVELIDQDLIGTYHCNAGKWFISIGNEEEVFNKYSTILSKELGKSKGRNSPRVWCSWYSMYEEISEEYLSKVIDDLLDYPFDVVQIDDGWQHKVGDWKPNTKFPSGMKTLAEKISSTGKKAGLWLAPLLVVPSSETYKEHQDWLLRSDDGYPIEAGYNWNELLYTLDTTKPQVLEWLSNLMKEVRSWGYEYVKLDFLYAGALNGIRYQDIPRETAFRLGLRTMQKALGDAFLLTCGTPILPSIGLCDAMRIGPDVSGDWSPYLENKLLNNYSVPGVQNAIRTSINRLWLQPLIHTDPDVVYFQNLGNTLSVNQKELLRSLAIISKYHATSDLPHLNSPEEKEAMISFLNQNPAVTKINQFVYKVGEKEFDFYESITLLPELNRLESFLQKILKEISNLPFVLKIFGKYVSLDRKQTIKKYFNQ